MGSQGFFPFQGFFQPHRSQNSQRFLSFQPFSGADLLPVFFLFWVFCAFSLQALGAGAKGELTLYTSRKTHLIKPLLELYQAQTGVKIKHVNNKAGVLIQKLKQEGNKSPADLLLTVDAGNLSQAAALGLLTPLKSKILLDSVPSQDRGKGNMWVGLSLRARTLFFNKEKVQKGSLKGYGDLAHSQWKGRLCLRTSRKVYNQSLVASLIKEYGELKTKKWVEGWVRNLAQPVFTSDSQLLQAIDKGLCDVGIANTYYLARLLKEGKAQRVQVFWPSQKDSGVHVNVSGAGIVRTSTHKKEALRFLEWLVTPKAQKIFAGVNHEYPVVKGVEISPILKKWGPFDRQKIDLGDLGAFQKKAVLLMDSVRYL